MNELNVPEGLGEEMAAAFRAGRIAGDLVAEQFAPEAVLETKGLPPYLAPLLDVTGKYEDGQQKKAAIYGYLTGLVREVNRLNKSLFAAQSELRRIKGAIQ